MQQPDSTLIHLPKLTDSQFNKFSALIYEKTGIYLKLEKKELLNARLGKRLRACRLNSFEKYFDYVISDRSGRELILLIDSVSTNFTNFFREQAHFDFLSGHILPPWSSGLPDGKRELIIWSSACSSGEEPYTIAMVLEEFLAQNSRISWSYKILASDISTRVLAKAESGVYSEENISKVPAPLLKKYFQKGVGAAKGFFKVKKVLREKVTFKRVNLMEDFPWGNAIDVIFCRNVMIYFNSETQQNLVRKFYGSLAAGGYLFIGHSESIARLQHNFSQVAATAYVK